MFYFIDISLVTSHSAYYLFSGFHRLLSELTDLEELDLSSNYFNHSDLLSSLSGLSSLKFLGLSNNALTSASLHDRGNVDLDYFFSIS